MTAGSMRDFKQWDGATVGILCGKYSMAHSNIELREENLNGSGTKWKQFITRGTKILF